ncbi:MAG: DEAD/DEAH box helicase [Desulfovibrionaceae bacterium]
MQFDSFSFDRRVEAGIRACGWLTPTPIQIKAIPAVSEGRDVLGLAQTGTGKTAAFALPILNRLLAANAPKQGPVRVLVLAPTRELAMQTHQTFISLGKETGIRGAVVFGGVGITPQVRSASRATVITACPGRLLDLLNQGLISLKNVETLVIDEADRMFDMGFLPDIKKIIGRLPAKRQNLFFSATMPKEVESLFAEVLNDPFKAQVDMIAPAKSVSHVVYSVPQVRKADFLEALLDSTEHDCVLVFTRTKHRAKYLAEKLATTGRKAIALQGNMSQNKRQSALDGFKAGRYRIMVATDIAARGIDCSRITHVVNYDVPDTADTYMHRIGRTGRAERTGEALTLVCREESSQMRWIERTMGQPVDVRTLEGFDNREPERSKFPPQRHLRRGNDSGDAGNSRPAYADSGSARTGNGGKPWSADGKPRAADGKPRSPEGGKKWAGDNGPKRSSDGGAKRPGDGNKPWHANGRRPGGNERRPSAR